MPSKGFAVTQTLFLIAILIMSLHSAYSAQLINGAGATLPFPIYSKWVYEYNKIHPDVEINFQSIGSGAGIKQLLTGSVDFGATDVPMSNEELSLSNKTILHIPMVLGAVVLSYNIANIKKSINLTPEIISGIYLGKIKKWNDLEITKINPKIKFPDLDITPIYRADGSGTSAVFTDYLSKVSEEWSKKVGHAKSVKWPVGLGAKGNEGVSGMIKQMPGTIGYIEQVYAIKNNFLMASIKNISGHFVVPSFDSITSAATAFAKNMPNDFRASITNASGEKSYPIASYTYILIYKKIPKAKGKKLIDFLKWSTTKGQVYAEKLSYVPLPESMMKKVDEEISQVEFEK